MPVIVTPATVAAPALGVRLIETRHPAAGSSLLWCGLGRDGWSCTRDALPDRSHAVKCNLPKQHR